MVFIFAIHTSSWNIALFGGRVWVNYIFLPFPFAHSGHDVSSMYDMKLAKLRSNNRALAKALASQKIETQHWFVFIFFTALLSFKHVM